MATRRRTQALAAKLILAAVTIAALGAAALTARGSATDTPQPAATARASGLVARAATAQPAATPSPSPASTPSPARSAATPEPEADSMRIKRILDIGPIKFGDYAWDTKGVPDGPLIITVDLAAQTLSVFRDGYEIGAAAILYGADDKPTPLGTYPILMKDADHHSSTYDNAPMPYTLRLTNDGVAVHGTEVAWGYATHGCIGVPTAFAKLLFAQAKVGDRVIITRGKSLATGQQMIPHS